MKKYKLLVPTAMVFIFSSCDLSKASTEETTAPVTIPSTAPASATAPATNTAQPVSTQQAAQATNQTTTATPPANANIAPVQLNAAPPGVTLNPAHGQPGHDCSIPVGQPLKKTSGGSSPQITTTIPPQQQAPAPSVFPATNATVKLNPAHGQPGHRCDIPVGKPLN